MTANKSSESKMPGDDRLLWLIGGTAVFTFLYKLWQRIEPWYLYYHDKLLILAIATGGVILLILLAHLWNYYVEVIDYNKCITGPSDDSVYLGKDERKKDVYLKEEFRTLHAQVIGTTSAGKTESVILPWAIRDIERGNGLLIIDGKADTSFLQKIYSHVLQNERESDFKFFSLAHIGKSFVFNPLSSGSPEEIAERVFSSFKIENEYYRNVQCQLFKAALNLLKAGEIPLSMASVERIFLDQVFLENLLSKTTNNPEIATINDFSKMPEEKRWELSSGITSKLGHFSSGDHALIFSGRGPEINLNDALSENHICYFQLPTMKYPFLGEATGRLVLQSFQSSVSDRHLDLDSSGVKPRFFSCFLDDFQDYIYEGFGALINKARSANVGVVFSHQSLGDLDKVSPSFRNVVSTNTNIKVVMRTTDPTTCDHFAKTFGTISAEKKTKRKRRTALGDQDTGEKSVREVEEYRYHPNVIKNLPLGAGVVSIPHPKGVKVVKVSFEKREDLPAKDLPDIKKEPPIINVSEKTSPKKEGVSLAS